MKVAEKVNAKRIWQIFRLVERYPDLTKFLPKSIKDLL
jgi:hypothetical protein